MNHQNFIALEDIRIAKPCRADWDGMTGDDRARFCGSCHKNVYDLSLMTREAAQELIREREGNVCIRLHRRADGTVITGDCPVGITRARRPFFGLLAGFAALLVSGAAVANQTGTPATVDSSPSVVERVATKLRSLPVICLIADKVAPVPPQTMMGDMAYTPPVAPLPVPNQPSVTMGSPPPIMGKIAAPQPTPTPSLSQTRATTMGEPTVMGQAAAATTKATRPHIVTLGKPAQASKGPVKPVRNGKAKHVQNSAVKSKKSP